MMGFYKDGKWQPSAAEIASGEYMTPDSELRICRKRIAELERDNQRLREAAQNVEAEKEKYRQMAEHFFSPAETDSDICSRCSLNFRDPVHIRAYIGGSTRTGGE